MNFGEKIKKLRNEKNWTQEYVAKRLNISAPALSRYESGACEPKDLAMISQFAQLYNVSTDYLLGLSEEKTSSENKNIEQPNDEWLYAFNNGYNDLDDADKEVLKATFDAYLKARKGDK